MLCLRGTKNKEMVMKKRIMMVILVIVMIATFAGTVLADPPTHLRWEEPFYEVVDCGDFDVVLDSNTRIRVTFFSDENNNPMAVEYQIKYTGITTNTGTGTTVPDHTVVNGRRLLTGERDNHGVYYHVNVPGAGVVTLVAGRVTWDDEGNISFIAGPGMYEMFKDPGELAMLCETMAGH